MIHNIDIQENEIFKKNPNILSLLLKDKSTKQNIVWATDMYKNRSELYLPNKYITPKLITGRNKKVIRPRVLKSTTEKAKRTRKNAEVFTPPWICNIQNNLVDEQWFGQNNVFNTAEANTWNVTKEKITFPENKTWQEYVLDTRLEICCGEAPYLVSRYDTVTGEKIDISNRIGIIDRKLRVVNENAIDEKEWTEWAVKAFQNSYGYDFQGDNILLARENLLFTFIDYYQERFQKEADEFLLKTITNVIVWNIWQMDGSTMTVPYSEQPAKLQQISLFDEEEAELKPVECRIYDWKQNKTVLFKEVGRKK